MKPPKALATAWAVFLGCTTVRRFSEEMGISENAAMLRLNRAKRAGLVNQDRLHRFAVPSEIAEALL